MKKTQIKTEKSNGLTKQFDNRQKLPIRRDWQANDILIKNCYFKYLSEKNRIPTVAEVAKETGLVRQTVQAHEKERSFRELCKQFRPLTGNVMKKHYEEIIENGNPNLIKTWYDVIEDLKKGNEEDTVEQRINNIKTVVIQIVKTPEQIEAEKRSGRMIEGE